MNNQKKFYTKHYPMHLLFLLFGCFLGSSKHISATLFIALELHNKTSVAKSVESIKKKVCTTIEWQKNQRVAQLQRLEKFAGPEKEHKQKIISLTPWKKLSCSLRTVPLEYLPFLKIYNDTKADEVIRAMDTVLKDNGLAFSCRLGARPSFVVDTNNKKISISKQVRINRYPSFLRLLEAIDFACNMVTCCWKYDLKDNLLHIPVLKGNANSIDSGSLIKQLFAPKKKTRTKTKRDAKDVKHAKDVKTLFWSEATLVLIKKESQDIAGGGNTKKGKVAMYTVLKRYGAKQEHETA